MKILHNYDYLTASKTIYKKTKLLNIKQLYTYNTCILIYKISHKLIHSNITFTKTSEISKHKTRQASHLALSKVRTNYGKNNLSFGGAQLYNKLPNSVKEATSLSIFKKRLFNYVQTNESLY